jgi:hypothetical protein
MQVKEKKPWWMCALEEYFWDNERWQLVHNGQQNPDGQYQFKPEEVKRFTRKYRKGDRYIVFFYDLTKPMADVRIQYANGGAEGNKKEERFERV